MASMELRKLVEGRMKRRGEQFDDFPNWTFDADEVSAGVYKVTAIHGQGFRYENTGLDPDKLLEEAKDWARKSKVEPQVKQTAKNGAIFDWVAMLEGTGFTGQIYQIALGHLKGDTADFEPAWKRFLVEFQQSATQSPAQNTSGLNVKLEFLQMLLEQFPPLSALRTDPLIIDLVLAGCRMVGDKVVDPRFGECEITRRSIGDRFGVLYTMKTADGSPLSFSTEVFEGSGNNICNPLTILWQDTIDLGQVATAATQVE